MTYPRNAASPEPIAIGAVVQVSDGAVQTSGCTVRIKPVGVAEGDGGGTTAYSTDGVVLYTPTQAETDYTSFVLIAKKTGCIPVAVTVVTSASATAGYVGTDQGKIANATSTVNLSGTTIKAVTDAVTAGTVSDKTGYSLANLTVQASTILATGTHNPQSGDAFARLGAPAGASVSEDISTLLGRLTSSRAGYLDNLNVGGAVASQADVNALNQSASRRVILTTVGQYERPESGSSTYTVEARTYDGDGAATNADSTPTLAATGIVTGDLSANLSSATSPAIGVYRWTYTVSSGATVEQVRFDVSAVIGGSTFTLPVYTQVADFVAATFTTTDRTKLEAVYNKLPSKSYLAGTNNSDGDIQLDEATGQAFPANFSSLAISGSGKVTVGTNDDKTGYALSQAFPSNFASLAITGAGKVTVGTNDDKTGYSLSQTFPSNFSNLAITGAGAVTTGTVEDKTGYSVAANGLGLVLIEQSISAGSGLVNDSGTQLTSITLPQAVSLVLSAAAGLVAGASSNSPAFKPAGKGSASARISSTVTSDGRTAINLRVPD